MGRKSTSVSASTRHCTSDSKYSMTYRFFLYLIQLSNCTKSFLASFPVIATSLMTRYIASTKWLNTVAWLWAMVNGRKWMTGAFWRTPTRWTAMPCPCWSFTEVVKWGKANLLWSASYTTMERKSCGSSFANSDFKRYPRRSRPMK